MANYPKQPEEPLIDKPTREQQSQELKQQGRKELAKEILEIIELSGANPYNIIEDIKNHIGD